MNSGGRELQSQGKRKLTAAGRRALAGCCCCNLCCGLTPKTYTLTDFSWNEFATWFNEETPTAYRRTYIARSDVPGSEVVAEWEYRAKFGVTPQIVLGCGTSSCSWGTRLDGLDTSSSPKHFFEKRYTSYSSGQTTEWEDVTGSLFFDLMLSRADDGVSIKKTLQAYFLPDNSEDVFTAYGCSLPNCCPVRYVFNASKTVACPHNCNATGGDEFVNAYKANHFPCIDGIVLVDPVAPGTVNLHPGPAGCNRTDCSGDCGSEVPTPCPHCPNTEEAYCGSDNCYSACGPPPADAPDGAGINPSTGLPWKTYLVGTTDVGGTPLDFTISLSSNPCASPGSHDGCYICWQIDDFTKRIEIYCSDDSTWTLTISFPFTGGSCTVTCTVPFNGDCCPPESFTTETVGTPCSNGVDTATTFTGTIVYEYEAPADCEPKP